MKKRIAMISFHTCPLASEEGKETGGMNVYVLQLGRELARSGYQVDVFTRSQDEHNKPVVEVAPGFRVIHLVAGPQKPVHKKQLYPFLPDFVRAFHTFCRDHTSQYDVLHAHYFLSGLIVLAIQKTEPFSDIPFVQSFHTLALMKNLVARDDSETEDASRIEAEFQLGAQADAIVAASESDKGYIQYLYTVNESQIRVIPPGVNEHIFRPMDKKKARSTIHIPPDTKLILFVGRIEPLKGIDMLLYATKIVSTRNPALPVCVCIVGGDISQPQLSWSKTLQSLNALRHVLHLTASVTFVGQKSQEMLPYYYNAADVVVMPSHYESFGMAALEAMSCGIPVITTNAAGISSLIDEKHASLVTSVNNPLLLAHQIESLLSSSEDRDRMGTEIRNNVMDLTWGAVAARMAEVYDSL